MIEAKKSARNKLQKMERKEQHYSFRKVNTGLASVLLGFTLGGLAIIFTPGKVAAADNAPTQVTTTQPTSSTSKSTSTQATTSTNNTTATTADAPSSQTETVSTQVKTQVSYTGSNQNPATQETKTTFSGKKTGDNSYDWTNKSATVTTTVPVVSGYVANTNQVTQTVSANSDGSFTGSDNITGKSSTVSNDTYTSQVTYKAVGRIVPVDKNGNEITADIKGNYVAPVAYSNSTTRADQVVTTAAPTYRWLHPCRQR